MKTAVISQINDNHLYFIVKIIMNTTTEFALLAVADTLTPRRRHLPSHLQKGWEEVGRPVNN